MKKLFLFLSLVIFFVSCNSISQEKSYEVTKEELLKKEQENPAAFVKVEGGQKRNLIGQTVVKGTLFNKASVAVFKDVEIKLYFYSKTRALLETDKETIFEILQPGESKNFKTKYFAPKGTDSVALQVLGAKAVSN